MVVALVAQTAGVEATTAAAAPTGRSSRSGRLYFLRFVRSDTIGAVYWARPDGVAAHRIRSPDGRSMSAATVSPDGTMIAFATYGGTVAQGGPLSTWIANRSGAHPRRVNPVRVYAWCPAWSPDGRSIIESVDNGDSTRSLQLVTINGVARKLDVGANDVGCASFLNRNTILFERRNLDTGEVEIWPASTNGVPAPEEVITVGGCNAVGPVVSPDHAIVSFQTGCTDPARRGLYLATLATENVSRIVAGEITGTAWSPDGRAIAYGLSLAPQPISAVEIRILDLVNHRTTTVQHNATFPAWAR